MTFDSISSPTMSTFNNSTNLPRSAALVTQAAADHHDCSSNTSNNDTSPAAGFSMHATASASVAAPVQVDGQHQQHPARSLSLNFQHLKSHHHPHHHQGLFNQHQHQHQHHQHSHTNIYPQDSLCQSPLASPGILSLEQLLNSSHLSTAPASTTSSAPHSPATPQLHSFPHQQYHPSSVAASAMLSSPIDAVGPHHSDLSAWIANTMHAQAAATGIMLGDHGASSAAVTANANVDVFDHFMHYSAAYPEVHVNGLGLVDEALGCLASPIVDHHRDQALSSSLVAMSAVGAGPADVHGGFVGSHHGAIPGHLHWHQGNGAAASMSSGSATGAAGDTGCAYSLPSPVPSTRSSTGPADQHHASAKASALGYKGSPPPSDLWSLPLKSSLDLDVFSHGSVMSSAPTSPSMRLMTFAVDPEVIKQALLMQIGSSSGSDSAVGPSPLSASSSSSSSSPTMPAPSREGGSDCMDLQALFNNGGGNAGQVGGSVDVDMAMDDSPPSPPATPMVVNPKQAHEDGQVARQQQQHHQAQYQAPQYPNQGQMPMHPATRPPLSVPSSTYTSSGLTSPVLPSPMTAAFLLAQQTPLPPTPTTPSGAFDGHAASSVGAPASSNLVSYPETLPAPTKLCPAPVRRPRMRKRSTLSGDDGMGGSPPVGHHHPYAQHGLVATSSVASAGYYSSPSSPVTPTIPEHPSSPPATAMSMSAMLAGGTDESGNGTSKQYTCIKCDKSFKRKADCVRHARVHTGEKPYRCPCGESFARQDALRRHQSKAPLETSCRMALLNGGVLPSAFSGDDGMHLSPGLTVAGARPVTSLDRSPAALACVVALAPAPARE